jgi:adenosylcobinamide kinase/adenosylcobinamide-phosphate guanylyltransferase
VIVLVLGGTRSGKSAIAERVAHRYGGAVVYVATGSARSDDSDMARRIAAHRASRPSSWTTVEAGRDLVQAVRADTDDPMVVDALGTWVAAHDDLDVDADALVEALAARTGPTIVVSEEVGLAVHPTSAAGRAFVDVMGVLNRRVAELADEVLLVVAGRVLVLPSFGG